MRIPDDVICKVCQGVFCCAECRHKHEIKNHAIVVRKPIIIQTANGDHEESENVNDTETAFETIYLFCPICEKRPLPLQPELNNEMLLHIELNHLPLRCRKCYKIYNKINDLKEFSKCIHPSAVCHSQETLALNQSCNTDEASKLTVTKAPMPHCMTSQNSPMRRHDFNESHMTPISIINMRWKAKSKLTHEEFISDSVSSIKNISSISNSSIRRSMGVTSAVKGKVIRCSSTPVHLEMVFAKPKEQTFNATGGGHMSSIQYNSSCESDNSPAFPQPSSQALEPVNRYMKVAGSRPRISAVTPLRQVMSKSIQKAFAEHGLPASTAVRGSNAFQRKKMFDNTSSPEVNDEQSPQHPALDLRLSPAVRRSQSESVESLQQQIICTQQKQRNDLPNLRRKILLSAQKHTTESIVITRTEHLASVSSSNSASSSNGSINSVKPYASSTNSSYQSAGSNSTGGSVFKSCSSVEIITATTEQIQQLQSYDSGNVRHTAMPPLTPITRIPGAIIHKKLIKFETPKIESCDSRDSQNSPNDVFFTPNATPTHKNHENDLAEIKQRKDLVKQNLSGRFSPLRRPSIKECAHSTAFSRIENITTDFDDDVDVIDDENDEVFLPEEPDKSLQKSSDVKKTIEPQQSSGLWSLMTSVMRLPSRKGSNPKESPKNDSYVLVDANSNSIIKRCASIAGSLVRSKPLVDENELSSLKRKRTYTTDNQSTSAYLSQLNNSEATSPTSDLNTSSKRFRIHARRPIDRMRLNS
ncbi:mitosis initiation protein fs(1)Ya [Calliphora vicina]|uniref:mitosis initiation protein fs(1)Ya n=1 Tax=Calliphora vicina TaxID=7373 RepID=UPI00325C0014